jgi:general secretion pathway protein K
MRRRAERGAAVVMAMLVVAVAAMLVTGAFWRQSVIARQAENELSFAQAKWLMRGAIDWAGVILAEDARTSQVDHAGEPWAVPLADTVLNPDDGRDPVYLAGVIRDEQAKFNLRNLVGPKGVIPREVEVLQRLLALVGARESLATPIAERVLATVPGEGGRKQVALGLGTIDDLLGVEGVNAPLIEQLRPFVTVLPQPTPVNANTAPAEVLAARFDNLSLADARRLIASRDRAFFKDRTDVLSRITELKLKASESEIAVTTRFFSVDGTVSYRRARLQTQALLRREGNQVELVRLQEAA